MFNRTNNGFSLIELLVVVFIIGISASMAVLYIDTSEERLETEARKIYALLKYMRDDAIIKGKSFSMVIKDKEYSFARYTDNKWQMLEQKPYIKTLVSDDISLRLLQDSASTDISERILHQVNYIYFLPTGESTQFELKISNKQKSVYRISGTFLGELKFEKGTET